MLTLFFGERHLAAVSLILAAILVRLNGQETSTLDVKHDKALRITPNPAPRQAPFELCGNGGQCVPYYLCRDNNTFNADGENIISMRFGEAEKANQTSCKDILTACCGSVDILETPIAPPDMKFQSGCGYRHAKGVAGFQITGAAERESEFGEFPWMVMVLEDTIVQNRNVTMYLCGGSLIHPSVVLTAAHCVHGLLVKSLVIRAGEWDSSTKNEIYAHEDRFVKNVKTHPNFGMDTLFNDVALLFLAGEPMELAPNINTVCLPPQNNDFDSQNCFVSGWGKDIFGEEGRFQHILKKLQLPYVPHGKCQNILRKYKGILYTLHNSFICAGGEQGKDPCTGDGGSPLVCPIDPESQDRYFQTGIVAWGIGCSKKNVPGVYVKVSRFRNWIDKQFDFRGLDKTFYTA